MGGWGGGGGERGGRGGLIIQNKGSIVRKV